MRIFYISFLMMLGSVLQLQSQSKTSTLLEEGYSYAQKEDYTNALRSYLEAVSIEEKKQNQDTLALIYEELALLYQQGGVYEKSTEYFEKVKQINPSNRVLLEIGDLQMKLEQYEKAISEYRQVLGNYQKETNTETQQLIVYRKIVLALQRQDKFEEALAYNQKILETQQKLKDEEGIIIALNNIGYTQRYLKNYEQALQTFQEVLQLEDGNNQTKHNTATLVNLGITYQNIGDYENALKYLLEAKTNIKKENQPKELAQIYDLLSAIYFRKKDYYNAKLYNDLAIEQAKKNKQPATLSSAYQTTSQLYQKEEKYDKALEFFKEHLRIRDSLLVEERLQKQDLEDQQYVIERTENELKLLIASEEIKDALLREARAEAEKKEKENQILQQNKKLQDERLARQEAEKQRALQELLILQNQAEAEKREREISDLQRNKELQEAELQKQSALEKQRQSEIEILNQNKKLQETELQKQEEEIKRQEDFQRSLIGLIGLGILVIVLAVWFVVNTRNKNKKLAIQQEIIKETNIELIQSNEEIAAQRDNAEKLSQELAEKNEDITASIAYAQRIQAAILPLGEEISTHFQNHFILFKPRDVVSGDFYFFAHHLERSMMAAIDCTGHGVPGAFMSMIGSEILNEIIFSRDIVEVDKILNELHKGIRKALKQKESSNRDGMDLALISFDHQHKTLEFAGAKNPLIYIQNNELHQIKGDKFPIGGEQREAERIFTKHQITLDKPTVFYLFSDGYQDQFGGQAKRKFMIKRMKNLLLEIHQKDPKEQEEILRKTIDDWMLEGEEKQIDDILLLGVKV